MPGGRILLDAMGRKVLDATGRVVLTRADGKRCVCCGGPPPPPPRPTCYPEYQRPESEGGTGGGYTTFGGTLVAAGIVMCPACIGALPGLSGAYSRYKDGTPNGTFTYGVDNLFLAGGPRWDVFGDASFIPPSESSGGGCFGPDLACDNCYVGATSNTSSAWEIGCVDEATKRWRCVGSYDAQNLFFYGETALVEPPGAAAYLDFANEIAACYDFAFGYYFPYAGSTVGTGGTVRFTFPYP